MNGAAQNGPVLFINERQLVTFGDVRVPLVPDYEAVTLMEMAMSGNQVYLDRFYDDLADSSLFGNCSEQTKPDHQTDGTFSGGK